MTKILLGLLLAMTMITGIFAAEVKEVKLEDVAETLIIKGKNNVIGQKILKDDENINKKKELFNDQTQKLEKEKERLDLIERELKHREMINSSYENDDE